MSSTSALLAHFEETARSHHLNYDSSHDFYHIQRVVAQSLSICRSMNAESGSSSADSSSSSSSSSSPKVDELVVHLASLAHDLIDKKYLPAGSSVTASEHLAPLWKGHEAVITENQRRTVEQIVDNVSYSKEVKRIARGEETDWHRDCRELHCVQDADKLDAIGAFGILRCAAYSGASGVPLFTPSPDSAATSAKSSAVDHFHEKLFKLEGMMKTERGREMARKRTEFMKTFVEQVQEEWKEIAEGL